MRNVPQDPKDIVGAAIMFEQEGHKILADAANAARHPLSKATFTFLADQELKHIEVIKAYAQAMAHHSAFDESALGDPVTLREAGEHIKGIFAQYKPHFEEVNLDEDRLEIYSVALDMERHGHDFYTKAAQQAEDEHARRLYEFLAGEETKHFEIIQETRDFLKQPDAFMAMEEHWMTT